MLFFSRTFSVDWLGLFGWYAFRFQTGEAKRTSKKHSRMQACYRLRFLGLLRRTGNSLRLSTPVVMLMLIYTNFFLVLFKIILVEDLPEHCWWIMSSKRVFGLLFSVYYLLVVFLKVVTVGVVSACFVEWEPKKGSNLFFLLEKNIRLAPSLCSWEVCDFGVPWYLTCFT